MKVRCVNDQYERGFFRKKMVKMSGLTKGKVYEAQVFSNGFDEAYNAPTCAEFLIFNDSGEWDSYPLSRFEPIRYEQNQKR